MRERPASERFTREETYRETRLPVDHATTLLPEAYRSPDFAEIERDRVFAAGWVAAGYIGHLREPGAVLAVEVAGQPLVLVRDGEGELRGFYNVCRHRGTQLVDGRETVNRYIRCPYHAWAYDLAGRLVGAPLFEGSGIPEDQRAIFDTSDVQEFRKEDYGLLPVRTSEWGGLAFVTLDPEPRPLEEWLGDLPDRLAAYRLEEWVPAREASYVVEANWKLVAENFMEYYHLPWVHPDLSKVSRVEDHHRFQGLGMYVGMCTNPISRDDRSGWLSLPPAEGLEGDDALSGRFIWLFPNAALSVLPNHAFVVLARPEGPDRTVESVAWLTPPGSLEQPGAGEALEQVVKFWDEVNREDIEIVERVQRGLAARAYRGGRMCFRFEEPVHRFQNMVIDRMVGLDRIPPGDERGDGPMFTGD